MSDHIVKAYDDDLEQIKTMLAQMGGLAEDQLAKAVDAPVVFDDLLRRDDVDLDEGADRQIDRALGKAPDLGDPTRQVLEIVVEGGDDMFRHREIPLQPQPKRPVM